MLVRAITDGQIVLDSRLFAANQRPAVDVGLSVSRVGGKTQKPALRGVSGRLRLDYAQFLELEMFRRFGGMADERMKARIERGLRVRALLTQPRLAMLRLVDQLALLVALNEGVLDSFPVKLITRLRGSIAHHLDTSQPQLARRISETGGLEPGDQVILAEEIRKLADRLGGDDG